MTAEDRILSLGYTLPPPPSPAGSYLPFRTYGNLLVLSGVLSLTPDQSIIGKVGRERSLEEGQVAARLCALNALSTARLAMGTLGAIRHILSLAGYVNGVEGQTDSPLVINGASDFLVEVFGNAGKHTRTAVTVAGLPKDASVEIQLTFVLNA